MLVAQGPRVGDKTPIDAITAEYAKADPVYVAKTMVSLYPAHTFSPQANVMENTSTYLDTDLTHRRLYHKHIPTTGPSKAMAVVDGEVRNTCSSFFYLTLSFARAPQ